MHKMSVFAIVGFCLVSLLNLSGTTEVTDCQGRNFTELQDRINVGSCKKPPCKLRRKTDVSVEMRFTPNKDITNLQTNVYAEILGLPLPFVGVDGISACDKIFQNNGTVPAPCPLQKGVEYTYKNSFPIQEFYPRVSPIVHWSLSENGKDIICFEVAARII